MVESLPSEPAESTRRGAADPTKRLLVVALAALLIVGGAVAWRVTGNPAASPTVAKLAPPPKNPQLDALIETTRALQDSQQQAIDQLQEVQDLLRAQQAETKKASDRVAGLSARLDTLQQSFASIAPPVTEEAVPDKAEPAPRAQTSKAKSGRSARTKRQRNARR
ncbi:hypothetical protein HNR60_001957 [Rhodopseudomonas rhenobacensis]|uniref:Uncharacterized protein n=1 Tax=Rhodopseudomonas rhenobacensis TaxID=87461 RepID=A0A7W7Z3M6_9BRAD|nr:hypothetical protein [Rhodopseudomonas rhenobacensis]MBB5047205.1 hypothetical protein [Rhodopseudomonas rhenobacensis]